MLDYRNIRNERQWKSSTGLSEKKFHELSGCFQVTYENHHGVSLQEKEERLGVDFILKTYEDCLFFVLFQLKNGLCFDNLGLLIGSDGSNAQRNFNRLLNVFELTLEKQGLMPVRNFKNLEEFKEKLSTESEIIFDCTEHSTQRSKDYEKQKEYYSGKKKDTPIKN
jgi:hypothetical protein